MNISTADNLSKIVQLKLRLENIIYELKRQGIDCRLEEKVIQSRSFFRYIPIKLSAKYEHELKKMLVKACASYINDIEEPLIVRSLLMTNFKQYYTNDFSDLETFVQAEFHKHEAKQQRIRRVNQIEQALSEYFKTAPELALDGFIRFRLGEYKKAINKAIITAANQYNLEREYNEFINLLQYFVSIQTSKIAMVHVIHSSKRKFHVLRQDGSPLEAAELDDSFRELVDQAFSQEDIIVSTLLSLVPQEILLHTHFPEENVIRTLKQIFPGRINFCNGCQLCTITSHEEGGANFK